MRAHSKILPDDLMTLVLLESVSRGEIGTPMGSGVLQHRTDLLSAQAFAALLLLHRDGHVRVRSTAEPGSTWLRAILTSSGHSLLNCAAERHRDAQRSAGSDGASG